MQWLGDPGIGTESPSSTSRALTFTPYKIFVVVGVAAQHATRQVDAGKQSLRARVRKDFSRELASVAARASRPTGPAATDISAPSDTLLASSVSAPDLFITSSTRSIDLRADLKTPAAFFESHEQRCAPVAAAPAAHQPLAVFAAKHERGLLQAWESPCTHAALFHRSCGTPFSGDGRNFRQHRRGVFDPALFGGLTAAASGGNGARRPAT